MRNNKGFVLMETIIVMSVLSVALMTLYSSYVKIMANSKDKNFYDKRKRHRKVSFSIKLFGFFSERPIPVAEYGVKFTVFIDCINRKIGRAYHKVNVDH